jgi:hypothetical protein
VCRQRFVLLRHLQNGHLAAGTQLDKAAPILEQLETIAHELVKQIDGITVEALRRQAERMDEPYGTAGP